MDDVDLIHIHEDDWGLRNLYPVAAFAEVAADMRAAADAAEQNRAPDGSGWTDLHLIRPPSAETASFDIRLERLVPKLSALMPRVRRFKATAMAGFEPGVDDPYGHADDDPVCYGFDAGCFVKVEVKGGRAGAIWYDCTTADADRLRRLRAAFLAIDRLAPCVVGDYVLDIAGPVGDTAFLERYFALFAPALAAGWLSRLRGGATALAARIKRR
jgi:hypothetical protein